MSRKWTIEIEVHDDGYSEVTLLSEGAPLSGAGDYTGTLPIQRLMEPLVARVAINAEDTRRRIARMSA